MTSLRPHMAARRPLSRRGGILQGCLIAGGIVLVIIIAIVIWVALSWKGWTADLIKLATEQTVQQSQLPAEQKTRITKRVGTLADDFKNGKITFEQLGSVMEQIADSPLLPLAMVSAAEDKYIKPSSLPAEEKAAASRAMQRFARGVAEKSISKDAIEMVTTPIKTVGPDGQSTLKQTVTDAELREFVSLMKSEADKANIPDEDFKVNIADELDKAIDKALGVPKA
ncbi:MAG: hypothetical protein AB7K52_10035 [Phycisphaerales bacterium]